MQPHIPHRNSARYSRRLMAGVGYAAMVAALLAPALAAAVTGRVALLHGQ